MLLQFSKFTFVSLALSQDRLGWFDDESIDIQTIMAEKGQDVTWVTTPEGIEFGNEASASHANGAADSRGDV